MRTSTSQTLVVSVPKKDKRQRHFTFLQAKIAPQLRRHHRQPEDQGEEAEDEAGQFEIRIDTLGKRLR